MTKLFIFIILCFSLTFSNSSSEKYYIYDWPKEFHDVWPPRNATLHKEEHYDHSFNENNGAGKLLNPDIGLFSTWQFSLYKNVISRLLVSKFRTYDPTKAKAFIIPFDAGVHAQIDHRHGNYLIFILLAFE